jgi:hypothetical protein
LGICSVAICLWEQKLNWIDPFRPIGTFWLINRQIQKYHDEEPKKFRSPEHLLQLDEEGLNWLVGV